MTLHIPPHRPATPGAQAFLDNGAKKLLIANEWRDAAGGGTFATHDPASGALLCEIAEGAPADGAPGSGEGDPEGDGRR